MVKYMGAYNGNRKCKKCNGRGFTFDGTKVVMDGMYNIKTVNEKQTCSSCHGKGVK